MIRNRIVRAAIVIGCVAVPTAFPSDATVQAALHGQTAEARYGTTSYADCGTDGQCRAYAEEVLGEDDEEEDRRVYWAPVR